MPTVIGWGLLLLQCTLLVQCHSWIDAMWCSPGTLGYPRNYRNRTDLPPNSPAFDRLMTYKIENYNSITPLCAITQKTPTQADRYPRLTCPPNATVHFRYNSNGHVTNDKCLPKDPRGCDGPYPVSSTWYILWNRTPSYELRRFNLPKIWNASHPAVRGGVKLVGNGPFDDGLCGQVGSKRPREGQPCEGSFQLPSVDSSQRISLVWFWAFNRIHNVGEEYTTCFDVDIEVETESG
ncbi:hypothetical protein H257_09505 [Aphanomyces astaci]|uniref:DUF7492 domain-containing protein n=2 Tax=Aphanomyces astaci TaxID=112090 RepID=W4G9Z6_APHAT|nr:hypothetical protein H257_09505 [Aphanomyces astaci]ETV76495.1 hypothetical protein H257_09505 [Aphanomyces astaci]|eukprot:XP_009834040.1 hypothetical protein H257_09505 [Aphanomyces astaci]